MPQTPIEDAIRDLGDTINQNVAHYQSLPPLKKARYRAGGGTALVVLGIYAAAGRHAEVWGGPLPLAIWAAIVAFGGLWFCVGIGGARSPRDVMSAVWSAVAVAVFGFLTIAGAHLLDGSDFNFYLEGVFAAALAGSLVRLWLAVRGMPSSGLDQVRAQQAHGRAREATPAEAAARLAEDAPRQPRQFRD